MCVRERRAAKPRDARNEDGSPRRNCSVSKLVKRTNELKCFFGLCLILFGFGNIVADFHVLFRVRGN